MRKVCVLKPWSYSLRGYDSHVAAEGATLELSDNPTKGISISESLATDGIISGHLEEITSKKMMTAAPENKGRTKHKG